ncbi:hypothetical protein [Tsukamurella paurometabola]
MRAVQDIPRRKASYQRQRAVAGGICNVDTYRDVVRSVTGDLILP